MSSPRKRWSANTTAMCWSGADSCGRGLGVNDNVTFQNRLSIVADPFAHENFGSMRYAEFGGVKWKVTDVKVQYPRLILTFGGIYHE